MYSYFIQGFKVVEDAVLIFAGFSIQFLDRNTKEAPLKAGLRNLETIRQKPNNNKHVC